MKYTINEVSNIMGISAHTIRYYEKEGLVPNVFRNEAGIRLFDESDLKWIEFILCVKKTGMSISSIRNLVDLSQQGEHTINQRMDLLQIQRKKLIEEMNDINKSLQAIDHKIDWYKNKLNDCE